jgi:hypothetical protein
MRKEQLIAGTFAIALSAAPGIALAQNTDTGTHNAAGANFGSNGTSSSASGNTATANNNADNSNNPASLSANWPGQL